MSNALLRMPEVIKRVGLSRATIYARVKDKTFPQPVSLGDGGRAIGFVASEIDEWIAGLIAARDCELSCPPIPQSEAFAQSRNH